MEKKEMKVGDREKIYLQALEQIIYFNGDMSLISGIFQIKNIARNALNTDQHAERR